MIKNSILSVMLTLTAMTFKAAADQQDTCTLNFETGVNALIEKAPASSYFTSKDPKQKLQIEAVVLPTGTNLVTYFGGCEHLIVSINYAVDPNLQLEQDVQNVLAKAEQLLEETPFSRKGKFYKELFSKGLYAAKLSPYMSGPQRINLSTGTDPMIELSYGQRGVLSFQYWVTLSRSNILAR